MQLQFTTLELEALKTVATTRRHPYGVSSRGGIAQNKLRTPAVRADMPIPAAQYVRVSTGQQRYSLAQQKAVIERYACQHGFQVIKTYTDLARSGLGLKQRNGLRRLLMDVVTGAADYKAILVHDVSRWGRFQDADESGCYEFLCKQGNVPVHYCAELFPNDGAAQSTLLKALKRMMAGEYSRELSSNCFRGQARLAQMGFRVGGRAGYGMHRMVVSKDGLPRFVLQPGQYKSLSTDRIILVPDEGREGETVREIFRLAATERRTCSQIADELNKLAVPFRNGGVWRSYAVRNILTNPKYAGQQIWNRCSGKLGNAVVRNAPEKWIVKHDAFRALVDRQTFDRAQQALRPPARHSDEELLSRLKCLLAKSGRLTAALISGAPGAASIATYRRRFGGLRRAYPMVGYSGKEGAFVKCEHRARMWLLRDSIVTKIGEEFGAKVRVVRRAHDMRPIVRLDTGIRIAICLCRNERLAHKRERWRVYCGCDQGEHLVLLCLMNAHNDAIEALYLTTPIRRASKERRMTSDDPLLRSGLQLNDLSELYEAAIFLSGLRGRNSFACRAELMRAKRL